MRYAFWAVVLVIYLLPFDIGYAGSFVITQGFWNTRGNAVSTSFSGDGIDGTASGFGFMTPMSGETILSGAGLSLSQTLTSEVGRFTVNGMVFPVDAAHPSGYTLQLTGQPMTLPTSSSPSLTLESTALLAGTLWLCADAISPCATHTVTGTGIATLQFLGTSLTGATPAYQLANLQVAFGSDSNMPLNATQATASYTHAAANHPGMISNPEPATLLLLGSGLVGVGIWKQMRKKGSIHR